MLMLHDKNQLLPTFNFRLLTLRSLKIVKRKSKAVAKLLVEK